MQMLIGYEDAQKVLSSYYSKLWGVITDSWNEYHNLPSWFLAVQSKRGRATSVNDIIVSKAKSLELDDDKIKPMTINDMFCLLISTDAGVFAFKFKKLSADGHSRSVSTMQLMQFKNQDEIEGMERAHHLEIGYVLNDNEDEISAINIVCPSGMKGIYWKAEVTPHGIANSEAELFEFEDKAHTESGFKVIRKDIEDNNEATGTN